jgi:hypothetical protein
MAWNASNQQTFVARQKSFARAMQDLRDEAARLVELWNAEGVSGDPAFVDTDGITTTEQTDLVTLFGALDDFFNNQAVATSDRKTNLTPFIVDR